MIQYGFLSPAVWLAGRLRVGQQLLAAGSLLVLPLLGLAAFQVYGQWQEVGRLERQRAALTVQLPAQGFVAALQGHLGARLGVLAGESEFSERERVFRREIDTQLTAVRATGQLPDVTVGDVPWLREFSDTETMVTAYGQVIDSIRDYARTAATEGGLGFDNQLAGQLLIDTLTSKLPAYMDAIATAEAAGAEAIRRGRLSGARREALTLVRGVVPSLLDWMRDNADRLSVKDAAQGERLMVPLAALESASMAFQEALTTKVINTSDYDFAPHAFVELGRSAVSAALDVSVAIVPALDARLAARQEAAWGRFAWLATGVLIAVCALVYVLAGMYRSMIGQVRALEHAALQLADGDLRCRLSLGGRGEIVAVAAGFNAVAGRFCAVIGNVNSATRDISRWSADLLASGRSIASAAADQRTRSAEVAVAVEQVAAETSAIAERAHNAAGLISRASADARQGCSDAERAARDMQQALGGINSSVRAVLALRERSREIGHIIRVIQEIAEQTNLLALNAAIEAARAGESGRGFSVVADEVRKLADRTRGSTDAIARTIDAIQQDVQQVSDEIRHGAQTCSDSVGVVEALALSLDGMSTDIERCREYAETIVRGTQAQTERSAEITRSIQEVAVAAESNQAAVDETAGMAERLSKLAEALHSQVAELRT